MITYQDVINNEEINMYIKMGNDALGIMGYTDHSTAHTVSVGRRASEILSTLGYSEREIELAKIAGYIHDIGNVANRFEHAQTGAIMAFSILSKMGMPPDEIGLVMSAVGNHDEETGICVSPISAALIIADKTDVRRSRVRNTDFATFDIHDRVNYAAIRCDCLIDKGNNKILLDMEIDTEICSVVDYFEIFLTRMLMCKRAAEFLKTIFNIRINGSKIL